MACRRLDKDAFLDDSSPFEAVHGPFDGKDWRYQPEDVYQP